MKSKHRIEVRKGNVTYVLDRNGHRMEFLDISQLKAHTHHHSPT